MPDEAPVPHVVKIDWIARTHRGCGSPLTLATHQETGSNELYCPHCRVFVAPGSEPVGKTTLADLKFPRAVPGESDGEGVQVHPNHICRVSDCCFRTKHNIAGNDCPACGKKGTVYRCPVRYRGGHWSDGKDVVCYVCVNCTLGNGDPYGHKIGCSPGLGKGLNEDTEYWEATPEMSEDLMEVLVDLYRDRMDLAQIRKGLGLPSTKGEREMAAVREEYDRHNREMMEILVNRQGLHGEFEKMVEKLRPPPRDSPSPGPRRHPRRPPGGPAPCPRPPRGPRPSPATTDPDKTEHTPTQG